MRGLEDRVAEKILHKIAEIALPMRGSLELQDSASTYWLCLLFNW